MLFCLNVVAALSVTDALTTACMTSWFREPGLTHDGSFCFGGL